MKVVNRQREEIATLEDWEAYFKSTRNPEHWKEGRSAYSLADFIINQDGGSHLKSTLSLVLGTRVHLETATPEFEAKFDSYPNPSQLDLGICGCTVEGLSLFVGVEAKVDEPFGNDTVDTRYQTGLGDQKRGRRTKVPERVRGLVSLYAPGEVDKALSLFGPIRYQLLTGRWGRLPWTRKFRCFWCWSSGLAVMTGARGNRICGTEVHRTGLR